MGKSSINGQCSVAMLPEGREASPSDSSVQGWGPMGTPIHRSNTTVSRVFFGGSIHNTPVLMMECPNSLCELYIYDGLSKCLFPVLLINRNSMRAASCLPSKNMTYLHDVKTWEFFVTFGNLSKTTGIG